MQDGQGDKASVKYQVFTFLFVGTCANLLTNTSYAAQTSIWYIYALHNTCLQFREKLSGYERSYGF